MLPITFQCKIKILKIKPLLNKFFSDEYLVFDL